MPVFKLNVLNKPLDSCLQTALSTLEEIQHNQNAYQQVGPGSGGGCNIPQERSRSMGVGPMRSRPIEKRHDTSPYSGVPYLSPPLPETWRRTNSDSALHQSANEACQSGSSIAHRRGASVCGGGESQPSQIFFSLLGNVYLMLPTTRTIDRF
jgi:hypothetical protein